MVDEPITIQILRDIRDEVRGTNKRLESLEATTSSRFESLEAKVEGIDSRLEGIDSRLEGIDSRLEGIDSRFDGIDRRFDALDRTMMAGFKVVKESLDGIRVVAIERHLDLDARVRALENTINPGGPRR